MEEKRRQAALVLEKERKREEKELWWDGAEFHKKHKMPCEEIDEDASTTLREDDKMKQMKKYLADYSRWDEWVPDDPATLLEVLPEL